MSIDIGSSMFIIDINYVIPFKFCFVRKVDREIKLGIVTLSENLQR